MAQLTQEDYYPSQLHSGDWNNSVFYSYLLSHENERIKVMNMLMKDDNINTLVTQIFDGDISNDQFISIMYSLTMLPAALNALKAETPLRNINDLCFATLVNFNASNGRGTKIRSFSALLSAHDSAENNGTELDYREYIINTQSDSNFKGDYVTLTVFPATISVGLQIKIPIVKPRFLRRSGLFRICTDRVPSFFHIIGDPEDIQHTIPPHLWYQLLEDGLRTRGSLKFPISETTIFSKGLNLEHRIIDEILSINDFHAIFDLIKLYDVEIDTLHPVLLLNNCNNPPEIEENLPLSWQQINDSNRWWLKSSKFYVVSKGTDAYHILVQ